MHCRLFRFPGRKHKPQDRDRWIQAIHRADPAHQWNLLEPVRGHVVCSAHFIDGEPTVMHPDPSIFPLRATCGVLHNTEKDTQRKARIMARETKKSAERVNIPMDVDEHDVQMVDHMKLSQITSVCALKFLIIMLLGIIRKVKSDNILLKYKLESHKCVEIVVERSAPKIPLHDVILRSDSVTQFYTGLRSRSLFDKLCKYITPFVSRRWQGAKKVASHKRRLFHTSPGKFGPKRKLCAPEEFLLTLMKLKLGLTHRDLGTRFDISTSLASKIFHSWLDAMSKSIGQTIVWFTKEHIKMTMPDRFRRLPELRAIIDCSEIFIETPKDPILQNITWSSYKHHNTAKFLIAVAPNSKITFISEMFGGRTSDREITLESGFLDKFDPFDMLQADKGFHIRDECDKRNITIDIPAGLRGKTQMTKIAVERTKRVATLRILVEQVIRRLKTFKILSRQISITEVPSLHKIVIVCAALVNFKDPIYKD